MGRVTIPSGVLADLLARAAAEPEREVCGLLFGDGENIAAATPATNVAADPRAGFEIDPGALFAALRTERNGGPKLIGHYHSHPNGSAAPSPRDRAAADPGRLWLILAGGDARLWLAEAAGFSPRAIKCV